MLSNFNALKLFDKANKDCYVIVKRLSDNEQGVAGLIYNRKGKYIEAIAVKIYIGNLNGDDDEVISIERFNTEYEIIDIDK